MQNADFNFIYIFRRRDGAAFTPDDKRFAADNLPPEINRRKLVDGGKAVIVGSNFLLPQPNWAAMSERFSVEDRSKPQSELPKTNVATK